MRAGGGSVDASVWSYYALNRSHLVFDLAGFAPPPPCTSIVLNSLRLSNDWLDPAASGMAPAVYYDANTPAGRLWVSWRTWACRKERVGATPRSSSMAACYFQTSGRKTRTLKDGA